MARLVMEKIRPIPGLVDLDSSVKPDKPTIGIDVRRDAASDLGCRWRRSAGSLRTLVGRPDRWATGARPTTRRTT
jgi:HAE1 family hydrophobic/amphiphilic exporter-1